MSGVPKIRPKTAKGGKKSTAPPQIVCAVPPKNRNPPTLASLCIAAVTSKIERYPPEALGMLYETEWEAIVRLRHSRTAPRQQQQRQCGGIDGKGRMMPAIGDKVMKSIEDANPHLAQSEIADKLVWKDCVNSRFKAGGPSRPLALSFPWPVLVERLKTSGADLLGLLQLPKHDSSDADEKYVENIRQQRFQVLNRCISIMSESPMSVALLTASGVGKAVSKFIKGCSKSAGSRCDDAPSPPYFVDVWTARLVPTLPNVTSTPKKEPVKLSPLTQLEMLLQGWKQVASADGVQVAKKGASAPIRSASDCSGRGKKTTEEQHREDMRTLQSCSSWRELHAALVLREAKMVASHGARMRQTRENLQTDRPKIGRVTHRNAGRCARREAILDGSRGMRALATASRATSSSTCGSSKLQQLRKESAIATSRQKAGLSKVTKSSFGFSIANATSSSRTAVKRSATIKPKEVALGGGKRMKVPQKASARNGVVAAMKQKQRANLKNTSFGR